MPAREDLPPDRFVKQATIRQPGRLVPKSPSVLGSTQTQRRMAVRVYKTADQAITTGGGGTLVTWNVEDFDTSGLHDNAVNNTRLTIPGAGGSKASGLWLFNAQVRWASNIVGDRSLRILKNGTIISQVDTPASFTVAGARSQATIVTQLDPVVSDYFEVQVLQTSGGDLNIQSGITLSFFGAVHLW